MSPEGQAAKAMREAFKDAHFDQLAYQAMEQVMAKAIREAVAAEREACAKAAESHVPSSYEWTEIVDEVAAAIRARE